jgi:hypothetical protein
MAECYQVANTEGGIVGQGKRFADVGEAKRYLERCVICRAAVEERLRELH